MNLQKRYQELVAEKFELTQKRVFLHNLLQEVRNLNKHLKSEKQELSRVKDDEDPLSDRAHRPERPFDAVSKERGGVSSAKWDASILDNPEHINTITLNLGKNTNSLDNTFKDVEEFDDSDEEISF